MSDPSSSVLSSDLWWRLPTELIREIALYAASGSSREACTLRLVARHVNLWVLPLVFSTLTLATSDDVIHFTTTISPPKRRKVIVPALVRSAHENDRSFTFYHVESLALVLNIKLPSVEDALESVAPVFHSLQNLAIAGQNLTSHAHWLRKHPIRPRQMMIIHFGRPQMVNFREPIFERVTHLYTAVLLGHRNSSVVDLPSLTHLAVYTRLDLAGSTMLDISRLIRETLASLPRLQSMVLSLDSDRFDESAMNLWTMYLGDCLSDSRFFLLPYQYGVRVEWQNLVMRGPSVWERAKAWQALDGEDYFTRLNKRGEMVQVASSQNDSPAWRRPTKMGSGTSWEIDLVELERYVDPDPIRHRECFYSFMVRLLTSSILTVYRPTCEYDYILN
ncbi:hypothetical protein BD779DRAFT_1709022 [Infundibulicybe gibba]|nr:hypothetical protein BD779DRAFT_1709022 [Infundibulicybe gibba]